MVNLKHVVRERSQDAIHMKHPEKVNLYRPIAEGRPWGWGRRNEKWVLMGTEALLG